MAVYRNISISFWSDSRVKDDFTPEDKYFYLYLLTNPQTNICGCYEVSLKQMEWDTGYNRDTIERLIERFEKIYNVIRYSRQNKEILLLNWHKYNWSGSEKTIAGIKNVAKHIKTEVFRKYIFNVADCIANNTPIMGHICPIEASVTDTVSVSVSDSVSVSVSDSVSDSVSGTVSDSVSGTVSGTVSSNIRKRSRNKAEDKNKDIRERIITCLNQRCGTNFRSETKETVRLINGRLNDGYAEQDFLTVIDKKANEWIGTENQKYLRPSTLFNESKFESYLNQTSFNKKQKENDIRKMTRKEINSSRQSQFEYLLNSIREDTENEQNGSKENNSINHGNIS